jgi:hypothetical protein
MRPSRDRQNPANDNEDDHVGTTNPKDPVRITLTPAQAQEVKQATAREAEAIEFTVEELEQRIAPKLASNSNETHLIG